MQRIRAVLFDIDGTLLDSNDAHAHAWLDALRGHGKNVPFELLRSKIGMGADKLLRDAVDIDADSPLGRSIVETRINVLKAHYLPDVGPFPGARSLVDRIRARGLMCIAVSSAKAAEAADLLRAAAVADLLDPIITADDADRSKPDPDLVAVAVERSSASAGECILVGDTPYDVEAGNRAGVAVIALRCGGWSDGDLEGAIAIYDGPSDLASQLDRSPIMRGVSESALPSIRALRLRGRRPATSGA